MSLEFIENWKKIWFRRWSTWLAAVNGLFVGYVFSQPILVIGLLGFVPYGGLQIALVIVTGLLAFGLPVWVATLKQPKLDALQQENSNEPSGNSSEPECSKCPGPAARSKPADAAKYDAGRHADFYSGQ